MLGWRTTLLKLLPATTTQQPYFSMEFLGENNCSSVALIALIIYLSLGPILDCALLFCSALLSQLLPGRNFD